MVGTNIKTGVDKLVELISEKKKVSVDEAAKKLGVGKNVVQEWAEFLEEEGNVDIDYSFSKVWIIEKRITKDDVLSSAKEVSSEKDAFARKIEVAITALQQDTTGFEDIRREFGNIQGHIKEEINTVKKQLVELEKFDNLRKNLDKDISKQREDYDACVKEAREKLKSEAQKYDELKSLIDKERKTIEQYGVKLDELKKLRNDYERTISSLKDSLRNIDHVIVDYGKRFEDSSKVVYKYKDALDSLEADLSERKGALLMKKLDALKVNEDRLAKIQLQMEDEINQKTGSLQSYSGLSDKVHSSVSGFFSRNINTEKLIAEIENDKTDLTKEMEGLKSKVEGFTLMTSNAAIKTQLKDIEVELKGFERKKSVIRFKIEKLLSFIKGK